MPDEQIFSGAAADGLVNYTVPGAAQFTLKAVNAVFSDNGAGSDWLPAVVILSDADRVIARAADQAVLVVGGDDAEVSWFPGVKNAGAGFTGLPQIHASSLFNSLPSGVATQIVWGAIEWSGGGVRENSAFRFVTNGAGFDLHATTGETYWGVVVLQWAAGFAGDRYVELTMASGTWWPFRERESGTPTGDILVVPFEFLGPGSDQLMQVNVFQSSGVDQGVLVLDIFASALPGGA